MKSVDQASDDLVDLLALVRTILGKRGVAGRVQAATLTVREGLIEK